MGEVHRLPDGRFFRVEAVPQHMVFAPVIPAGELDPLQKRRIAGPQQPPHGGAALGGVVIRQGKDIKARRPYIAQEGSRRVRAVGIQGVHVQIRPCKGVRLHKFSSVSFVCHCMSVLIILQNPPCDKRCRSCIISHLCGMI